MGAGVGGLDGGLDALGFASGGGVAGWCRSSGPGLGGCGCRRGRERYQLVGRANGDWRLSKRLSGVRSCAEAWLGAGRGRWPLLRCGRSSLSGAIRVRLTQPHARRGDACQKRAGDSPRSPAPRASPCLPGAVRRDGQRSRRRHGGRTRYSVGFRERGLVCEGFPRAQLKLGRAKLAPRASHEDDRCGPRSAA